MDRRIEVHRVIITDILEVWLLYQLQNVAVPSVLLLLRRALWNYFNSVLCSSDHVESAPDIVSRLLFESIWSLLKSIWSCIWVFCQPQQSKISLLNVLYYVVLLTETNHAVYYCLKQHPEGLCRKLILELQLLVGVKVLFCVVYLFQIHIRYQVEVGHLLKGLLGQTLV